MHPLATIENHKSLIVFTCHISDLLPIRTEHDIRLYHIIFLTWLTILSELLLLPIRTLWAIDLPSGLTL